MLADENSPAIFPHVLASSVRLARVTVQTIIVTPQLFLEELL